MTATPRRPSDRAEVWVEATAHFCAWRDGDRAGFDALVRLLTPVLWQVVRAYRLDAATAEDVLQEVWLTLARDPDAVRDPAAVGGWLLTTARRRAWRAVAPKRELAAGDHLADVAPSAPSAEGTAVDELASDALWRAVDSLDARCRRLLRIVAFDDRPDYDRISAEFAMPVGSIGPTRRRCLDKLRAHLEGDGRG